MKTALDDALDAVTGEQPAAPPKPGPRTAGPTPLTGLVQVRLEDLHPDPENPREQLGDIAALAASIREQGLIQPIIARHDAGVGLVIVAGHRRYAAVQSLGWISVEVIVRKAMAADDVLAKMLVENGQRSGLDPIEEARALNRLKVRRGCTLAELAQMVGRNQPFISSRLALLALPVEDQERLRAGQASIVQSVEKARVESGAKRPAGVTGSWHLGDSHDLAGRVRMRCKRLHTKARLIGFVGCGECWEHVIRADERVRLHQHSAKTDQCALCGQPPVSDAS